MHMRTAAVIAISILALFTACGGPERATHTGTADAIYFGGNIITMNDSIPSAEAIAIMDGKIIAVGSLA